MWLVEDVDEPLFDVDVSEFVVGEVSGEELFCFFDGLVPEHSFVDNVVFVVAFVGVGDASADFLLQVVVVVVEQDCEFLLVHDA